MITFHRTAAIILASHAVLLAVSATIHSPVWDEIGHLPAGLSHWQFGNFEAYRVNPTVERMVAALRSYSRVRRWIGR